MDFHFISPCGAKLYEVFDAYTMLLAVNAEISPKERTASE